MYANPPSQPPLRLPHFFTHWMVGLFVAFALLMAGMAAHAAPPPAGTSISNQASATYSDASGITRTVTSNVVQTTVQQIASLTLVANGAQNATPGSVVSYPHTLTNTGNGSDSFNLGVVHTSGGFTMTNMQIFADNGSGQPTGPALTSSGPLAAGAVFKFIVQGTVPAAATTGSAEVMTVTATSVFPGGASASNTDTTTVTSNAVVTLSKSASVSSGPAGTAITYTLTYTNTGNSTATAVAITDVLPAGLTYTAGSARWSATGATALSDGGGSSGTAPNTLTSGYTLATKTLLVTLNQVTAGQSGTVSFGVTVAAGTAPGTLNNTATTSYNNGAATVTGSSNTVPFTVQQMALVTLTGDTVAGPAAPGSQVSFTNTVTNTGNGSDTFNMTLSSGNFPAGTTFQLYKSDGTTPLVDTNADGTVDTGPLAAGASYNVILKATLPPSATNTAAPFIVAKTATSVFDPTKSASANDTLTAIAGAKVDLTNDAVTGVGVPGVGIFPNGEAAIVKSNAVNPGASTVFTLVANNTGPSPDSYNLGASTVNTFASVTLPAGWTVNFRADGGSNNCSTMGATITNTGTVAANGAVFVCAVVSVPVGSSAGVTDLYFRTLSPTSGVSDTVHDAVSVVAVRSITLTPNGAGQTYPGGSYVYSHTLTNTGNVLEGNGTLSTMALSATNAQAGWTSTLYYDANNNGVLDATDPLISGNLNAVAGLTTGLAPGAAITVFNKVIAPSGATPGAVDTTTITVTTSNVAGGYSTTVPAVAIATDSTTVIAGNLTLTKMQALDAFPCTGTPAGAYAQGNLSALPGRCVLYQVTVTNVGSANATAVVISDSTPSYTTLSSAAASTVGTVTGPAVGAAGTVTATIGTLTPGQSAVVTFGVKVDN
ncbi:beta strand repeat-containing protein [Polaromonas sp. UC242_47]|uniref:beta strand repeat-containing protein n=1 Tax=Polaromonas sp. UC242_47 TaxID=3374626 RepID=UPI0037ABBD6F